MLPFAEKHKNGNCSKIFVQIKSKQNSESRGKTVSESINVKHLEGVKKITIENLKKLGLIRKSTLKVKIFGEGKLLEQPSDENIKISKGVKIG